MTNRKYTMSVVLAAATLATVLFPLAESMKLMFPSIGPALAQIGIVPGSEPPWVAPVAGISAIALSAAAFVLSWKQKSFIVASLLVASGLAYTTGTMIAAAYLFGFAIPGPILGAISGLGILALGIVRSVKEARTRTAIIAR